MNNEHKIYKPVLRKRGMVAGFGLVLLILGSGILVSGSTPIFKLIGLVLGLYGLISLTAWFETLEIKPNGVSYRYGVWSLEADWTDFEKVDFVRNRVLCLIFKSAPPQSLLSKLYNIMPEGNIALESFRSNWTQSLDEFTETPLGQDLLHYAPHLFEQE